MSVAYTYMWEYIVAPEKTAAFERAYGASGDWVRLFRRAPGYLRTELHRELGHPQRFVTIDYWESKAAWDAFRTRYSSEFDALDLECNALTTLETEIGRFQLAESSPAGKEEGTDERRE